MMEEKDTRSSPALGDTPRKSSDEVSPKIAVVTGCIEVKRVRCGRRNCRCARGDLHGPYHYLRVQVAAKRFRRYVKNDDLSLTKAALLDQKVKRRQVREDRDLWRCLLGSLKSS
jgi:hypothetical protein